MLILAGFFFFEQRDPNTWYLCWEVFFDSWTTTRGIDFGVFFRAQQQHVVFILMDFLTAGA